MRNFVKVRTKSKHQADCIMNLDLVAWCDLRDREVTFCNGKSLVVEPKDFDKLLTAIGYPRHPKALPGERVADLPAAD